MLQRRFSSLKNILGWASALLIVVHGLGINPYWATINKAETHCVCNRPETTTSTNTTINPADCCRFVPSVSELYIGPYFAIGSLVGSCTTPGNVDFVYETEKKACFVGTYEDIGTECFTHSDAAVDYMATTAGFFTLGLIFSVLCGVYSLRHSAWDPNCRWRMLWFALAALCDLTALINSTVFVHHEMADHEETASLDWGWYVSVLPATIVSPIAALVALMAFRIRL